MPKTDVAYRKTLTAEPALEGNGSITGYVEALRAGDRGAAGELWERFAVRLVGLARARLRAAPRRAEDEEDAALSAFDSFCRAVESGQFGRLRDRGELWNLLVTITVRKAGDQMARERRLKRGGGAVVCAADLGGTDSRGPLDAAVAPDPTPELAAEMIEQFHALLAALPDPDLRDLALLRLEGYTNAEIAARLACARSTVQRRLQLIQLRWEQYAFPPPP